MSDRDNTDEGSDWYKRLCNSPPWTEEERLDACRRRADEIRRDGLPKTVTIGGKTITLEPVHVQAPRTELPDEATMTRMIEEGVKTGYLPHWTNWTPAVRYLKHPGKLPPSPKPIVFDGIFLGYDLGNGGFIL